MESMLLAIRAIVERISGLISEEFCVLIKVSIEKNHKGCRHLHQPRQKEECLCHGWIQLPDASDSHTL